MSNQDQKIAYWQNWLVPDAIFSEKRGCESNQIVRIDGACNLLNCQNLVTVTPDTLVTRTQNWKVAFASAKVGINTYKEGAAGEVESRAKFSP